MNRCFQLYKELKLTEINEIKRKQNDAKNREEIMLKRNANQYLYHHPRIRSDPDPELNPFPGSGILDLPKHPRDFGLLDGNIRNREIATTDEILFGLPSLPSGGIIIMYVCIIIIFRL